MKVWLYGAKNGVLRVKVAGFGVKPTGFGVKGHPPVRWENSFGVKAWVSGVKRWFRRESLALRRKKTG
ncbi:hypothetical protein [Bacillus marinisedimentorum]|uniref:hypothetical protein n=1 Tax=Bacillus marinisedimentorum TaxID=1821260 RepID=UPI001471554E|nr:hypothetical protein [Bacillus marinisedimentorum]